MKAQEVLRRIGRRASALIRSSRTHVCARSLVRGLGASVATVAIAAASLIRHAEAEGAEIRASCEAVAKADEAAHALYCLGFITPFRDFEQLSSSVLSLPPDFCVGSEMPEARLADIFVTYLAAHPEHQKMPARMVLRAALEKSHPCS